MLEDLSPLLKLWTLRLLSQPREWRKFVEKDKFADDDVAEWLGFDPGTGRLRKGVIPAQLFSQNQSKQAQSPSTSKPDFRQQVKQGWKTLRRYYENEKSLFRKTCGLILALGDFQGYDKEIFPKH